MSVFDDLDLHVVGLGLFLALPALIAAPTDSGILIGKIFMGLAFFIPQGRILAKVGDYSNAKNRQKRYLLLHEAILVIIALVTLGVWGLESLLGIR